MEMEPRLRNGFPRRMRLAHERDIRRVLKQGSRARGPKLVVVTCANGLGWSRLGVSFGRRVHRDAVDRNRQRRIVKEACRLSWRELPRGYDLFVLAARPGLRLELEETRRELVRLASKAVERWREKTEGGS